MSHAVFVWNERYKTGLEVVDRQHLRLVELINRLGELYARESSLEELLRVFDELAAYTAYHFQTEERLMVEMSVSAMHANPHCSAHTKFIRQMHEARSQVAQDQMQAMGKLPAFFSRWLILHILGEDRRMVAEVLAIKAQKPLAEAAKIADEQTADVTSVLLAEMHELYDELAARTLEYQEANRHLQMEVAERQRTEEDNRLMAKVFANSNEAIIITDADNQIVTINASFTRLTGYLPEDVIGRNPRILSAGKMPPETFAQMWQSLDATGTWEGELWDRRKDGEIYPKWLSISVARDKAGRVTNYIGSFVDISERKASEERVRHLAHHDPLTGLLNRFSLQERLTQALGFARRNEKMLAVMLIDLDRFKTINDTLGHPVGDQLLIQVASRLGQTVRDSDIVARLGGDEFVIVLPEIESPTDAAYVAEKIVKVVSQPYLIDGMEQRTSPSIGICLYPDDADDGSDLIKKADVAMYHAKSQGRSTYKFFTQEIQSVADKRMLIEAELRTALEEQQFVLYYQPQLDLRTGQLVGVEALVRWRHPLRGLVPPLDFIPVAEETGQIIQLGDWVLKEACRQVSEWVAGGITHIRVSVNLSASQFLDRELPGRIHALLQEYGLDAGKLDLEVTESMSMASPDDTIDSMKELRRRGLSLSIDDFGTGYSSLSYLKLFPISTLKIDRSFVKDVEIDQNDADICDVTVLLAHKLGLDVVAEGVETEAQLKYLLSIGCEKIQGYLISRPLPADDAKDFILNNLPATWLGTVDLWSVS